MAKSLWNYSNVCLSWALLLPLALAFKKKIAGTSCCRTSDIKPISLPRRDFATHKRNKSLTDIIQCFMICGRVRDPYRMSNISNQPPTTTRHHRKKETKLGWKRDFDHRLKFERRLAKCIFDLHFINKYQYLILLKIVTSHVTDYVVINIASTRCFHISSRYCLCRCSDDL